MGREQRGSGLSSGEGTWEWSKWGGNNVGVV